MQTEIKKNGVAIVISDKINFKIMTVSREKVQYIMINGSIQEKDRTIINIMYPTKVRQILTTVKGEIENDMILVGNFKTIITPLDRSSS